MKNLYVRRLETHEIVLTVPVSNPSDAKVELVMKGMLRNMNMDEYFIDDSEFDEDTAPLVLPRVFTKEKP